MISRKLCLVGAFSVGKSSLLRRFVHEVFDDRYVTTLGVKIETKVIDLGDEQVKMIIWDMEGADPANDGERLITDRMKAYLQGVHGVLVIADGTRPVTVTIASELTTWLNKDYPNVATAMLLNKVDLQDAWQISPQQIEALSTTLQCFTTSALSGENVESTFIYLARKLVDQK